ncbi:MAG: RNA polymerase sigma factor [Solirubrobacteraceae bacterium]
MDDTSTRAGRSRSFADVYNDNVSRVYAFVFYRLGDQSAAEDLTQGIFERALRAWPRFDPARASEATWLLAIARNHLIDHYRRERLRRTEPLEEGGHPAAEDSAERVAAWSELAAALAELGERDREVIGLRFGADLSGQQIAELTGLTLANVQQIISRSLRKLRSILEGTATTSPDR